MLLYPDEPAWMVTLLFQKLEGIVLRTSDYGEANKILTIYTRELGKFAAVARGAKKPKSRLASVSQPFTYGYFVATTGRKGLGTIHQGEIIDVFRTIKEDLFLTGYASYCAELLDKSTEERERNPFLFEVFYQTIKYLDEEYDPQIIKNIFEMKMLPVLGYRPVLDRCVLCRRKDGSFVFSVREGGILCPECAEKDPYHLKVSQAVIRLLRLFYFFDLSRLGTINVKNQTKKELELCISNYYDEYSGLYLKSKKFLEQLKKLDFQEN